MYLTLHTTALPNAEVPISLFGADAVRMAFNPSTLPNVDRLKAIAAAFISECERLQSAPGAVGGREFAVAITYAQTASMWAVLAATKGL